MSRPLARPASPMTVSQVADHIYNHFVTEGNPRCATTKGSMNFCHYNHTGCAVGCCFTQEDAEEIERRAANFRVPEARLECRDIFDIYFENTTEMYEFLFEAQCLHDKDFANIGQIKGFAT